VSDAWSLAVYPFIEGEPLGAGGWDGVSEASDAARIIGRLHRAAPPRSLRRWSSVIPGRGAVLAAFDGLRPSEGGPYSDEAYVLLRLTREGVEAALAHHDGLVAQLINYDQPWVVSHGEPHSANFLRGFDGNIYLIDWDTVRLAPRERDYAFEGAAYEAYREVAEPPPLRPEVRELFDLRWHLQDLCIYAQLLLGPHEGTEDDTKSWEGLQSELARLRA
jgi:spectinomycin phosphotransferase